VVSGTSLQGFQFSQWCSGTYVFWTMMSSRLICGCWHFRGAYSLHLQGSLLFCDYPEDGGRSLSRVSNYKSMYMV